MARRDERRVTYWRDGDRLVRTVVCRHGGDYTHACTAEVFKEVAYAVEEAPRPTTLSEIADQQELPYTQVNVALEFLKDRVLVEVVRRRSRAASPTFFEDALVEFYALADADPRALDNGHYRP